jgi:TolB-like protein
MLARRPPFEGETPTDIMAAVLLKPPPPVEQCATIVPPALQSVVERSLRKDPAERYQTAEEMLSELRAIEQKTEGIAPAAATDSIRSSNRPAQSARWIGVAAIAVLLVGVAVFYGWRSPRHDRATAPIVPEKSIAVLPFQNMSDDKQNAYFADGVHEEILTTLAKVGDLKVISRTSVMHFRDAEQRNLRKIAQQLGAAYVLEGSVQRASNRIRITAQLIDTRTDSHVWADRFDGELADVFGIQTGIAQKIASQLKAALSPEEQAALRARSTVDTTAYDLYLQAREIDRSGDHGAPDAIQKEITLLDEAVARDPAFVPALCMLAQAHLRAYFYNHDHTPARLEEGEEGARCSGTVATRRWRSASRASCVPLLGEPRLRSCPHRALARHPQPAERRRPPLFYRINRAPAGVVAGIDQDNGTGLRIGSAQRHLGRGAGKQLLPSEALS